MNPPYSPVRVAGPLLFTAGQLGVDGAGVQAEGIQAQTRQALANVEAVLAPFGAGRGDIVKTTVFLSDLSLWAAMNEPYRDFFGPTLPARSAVAVGLPEGALVEIEVVAYLPPG